MESKSNRIIQLMPLTNYWIRIDYSDIRVIAIALYENWETDIMIYQNKKLIPVKNYDSFFYSEK